MVLFRITENEPSKMHNVRPYVYSRPWYKHSKLIVLYCIEKFDMTSVEKFEPSSEWSYSWPTKRIRPYKLF